MSLHARRGVERHTNADRYDDDPYDADHDYGSHTATNERDRARGPEVWELDRRLGPVLTMTPLPCRLCTPSEGYVCSFHAD